MPRPVSSGPVRRRRADRYNKGLGGARNHRYTVRSDLVTTRRTRGWTSEGTGIDPMFAYAEASLQAVLKEAADGRTLAMSFPVSGHPSQSLAQVLGSPFHQAFGNCEPWPGPAVPGGTECASAALDLPDRTTGIFQITRTLAGTGGGASCSVWSSYLGAQL